jgi:hypothetical protein
MTWPIPSPGEHYWVWQRGRCAFCNATPKRLVHDHDHATGLTRGYLCRRCNAVEAASTHPGWKAWRAGCNPATLLSQQESYEGWGYVLPTAVDEHELRAAINRLSA